MLHQLIRHFHFTRAERYGAVALLALTAILFAWPSLYRKWQPPATQDFTVVMQQAHALRRERPEAVTPEKTTGTSAFYFDPNTTGLDTWRRLGLPERVAHSILKYLERGGRFRAPDDLRKIYTLPEADFRRLRPWIRIGTTAPPVPAQAQVPAMPVLRPFDPNTATKADLLQLGLSPGLVERLLHYREKGGVFRSKPDFSKLYGLPEADYTRLEPYINLNNTTPARPRLVRATAPVALDINGASAEEWRQLPGIGTVRAEKIVAYRDKLGGFLSIGQLQEIRSLPDSVFQQIHPYLRLENPTLRRINLNRASAEEMEAHPYISAKQAQLIATYRAQHGAFTRPDDVERIAAFTDHQWLDKVKPYLSVE